MKHIESRYPLNENRTDLDRAYLCSLIEKSCYPNFLAHLVFSILPLPDVAEVARISVDVLIDSAIGLDSLTPLESYAVRSTLGFIGFEPLGERNFYDTELNNYHLDNVDWADALEALVKTAKSKPLTEHPAYRVIAPFLSAPASDVPCYVSTAIIEWTDYVTANQKLRKNTRKKPLRTERKTA